MTISNLRLWTSYMKGWFVFLALNYGAIWFTLVTIIVMGQSPIPAAMTVVTLCCTGWSLKRLAEEMREFALETNFGTYFIFYGMPSICAVLFVASFNGLGAIYALLLQFGLFCLTMLGWYSHLTLHHQDWTQSEN